MTITKDNERPVMILMVIEGTTLRVERGEQEVSMLLTARQQESRGPKTHRRNSWLEDYLMQLDGKEARGVLRVVGVDATKTTISQGR